MYCMVADSRHREKNVQNREKTFIIKKKLEKNFRIQKNISGSKTKLWNLEKKSKSRKIFRNREKYFRIEKTISKLRKMFKNREIFCYKNREKTLNSIISLCSKFIIKVCSKFMIKTAEWRQWHYSDIFIVYFNIFHTFL